MPPRKARIENVGVAPFIKVDSGSLECHLSTERMRREGHREIWGDL